MGYIKHHGILVTSYKEDIMQIHTTVKMIYDSAFSEHTKEYNPELGSRKGSDLVGNIVPGFANSFSSFFIACDGSKRGWGISQMGDKAREVTVTYLREIGCDFVEVQYGGDDRHCHIVSHNKDD